MTDYPKRPKFFACRVIRLLGKTCAAQEIGATGFALVTWVAMTEDAAGYSRAVTFYDGQLLPILGLESQKALAKARSKSVEAGWLHYVAGCKGRAGRYWAKLPQHAVSHDDNPSDEGHDSRPMPRQKDVETGVESGTIGRGIGDDRTGQRATFLTYTDSNNTPLTPQGGNSVNGRRRKRDRFAPAPAERSETTIKSWIREHDESRIPRDQTTVAAIVRAGISGLPEEEFFRAVERIARGES